MKTASHVENAEKSKKIDFLFMRHAESQDNLQHVVPYSEGCKGLTELGFNQARKAASYLKQANAKPGMIVASPLLRARQTAGIVADALQLDIVFSDLFQEQNLGGWEGKSWTEVMPLLERRTLPPQGETYAEFSQRMDNVVEYLAEIAEKSPLIIAHGGIWYGLSTRYSPTPLVMPSNAEIRRASLRENTLTYTYEFSAKETDDQAK